MMSGPHGWAASDGACVAPRAGAVRTLKRAKITLLTKKAKIIRVFPTI